MPSSVKADASRASPLGPRPRRSPLTDLLPGHLELGEGDAVLDEHGELLHFWQQGRAEKHKCGHMSTARGKSTLRVLGDASWWSMEMGDGAHGRARCCCEGRENRAGPRGHAQSPGLLCQPQQGGK